MEISSDDEPLSKLQQGVLEQKRRSSYAGKSSKHTQKPFIRSKRRMRKRKRKLISEDSESASSSREDLTPNEKEARPRKRRLLERSQIPPERVKQIDLENRSIMLSSGSESNHEATRNDNRSKKAKNVNDVKARKELKETLGRPADVDSDEKKGRDELSLTYSMYENEILSIQEAFASNVTEFECVPMTDERHIEAMRIVLKKMGLSSITRDTITGIAVIAIFKPKSKPSLKESIALQELMETLEKKLSEKKRFIKRQWDDDGLMVIQDEAVSKRTGTS